MPDQITDNAVTEEVVDPQPEVVETESTEVVETESVESEVATDTVKEQSKEDNSKFAEVRRKAEKESIDRFISEQYGESHGIHTKADYDKAIAEQKQNELLESLKDEETDPLEVYNKMKENDPEYQAMKQSKQETYMNNQIKELNADLKDLDVDVNIESIDDLTKLKNVDEITKHVESGKTLAEAYFLANKKEIINKRAESVQAETLKKVASLEGANPGSLNNPGETKNESIYNMSEADFKQMQEDVLMGRRK